MPVRTPYLPLCTILEKTTTNKTIMKLYLTPVTRVKALSFERNLLYSGLKDMPDNPIYPSEELDDDNN